MTQHELLGFELEANVTIRAPWDDDVRLIRLFNLATSVTEMMPRNILRIQLFKMIRNPFEIAFTTKS